MAIRPNIPSSARSQPSRVRRFLGTYRYFLLAGLMVPVIAYLLARVIQSPSEQVEATVRRMAQLVEQEDAEGLASFISNRYEGELEGDKALLMASAREYFAEVEGTRISIKRVFVRLEGDEAEVLVVYHFRATLKSSEIYNEVPIVSLFEENPRIPEKSYLRLVREGTEWRLVFLALQARPWAERFPEAREFFK